MADHAGGRSVRPQGGAWRGVLTGLIAGKPIWAKGGGIEAGIKAFFGALLAAGGMYAVRTWFHMEVDPLDVACRARGRRRFAGGGAPRSSQACSGGLYELDNTPQSEDDRGSRSGPRVVDNVRVASEVEVDDEQAPAARGEAFSLTRETWISCHPRARSSLR